MKMGRRSLCAALEMGVFFMLAEQRYAKMLELIARNGVARTAELVKKLGASSETIRKDLEYLDEAGMLMRVHGGAVAKTVAPVANPSPGAYVAFEARAEKHRAGKLAIARKAAELVREGQSIALDSGTTSHELALVLAERFTNLTIVTNSLKNAIELVKKPGFTVIVTGGILTADEHSFVSEFALLILEHINVDVMFLTTCGVSLANGITDQRIDEVRIHNKLREIARKVVVLADGSKFGESSLIRVCELSEVDTIITDDSVDGTLARQFAESGHALTIVSDKGEAS